MNDTGQRMTPGVVHLTGAGGQLGRALSATAPTSVAVQAMRSADLDVSDAAAVTDWGRGLGARDVVINCAAYTDVDAAETDHDGARRGNVDGPGNLAAACAASGAWLIHVSTDYVFAGPAAGLSSTPRTDPYRCDEAGPMPATVYGQTKLLGERAATAGDPTTTVVRTAWVYTGGPDDRDFVATMRRLAQTHDTLNVVADQTGSPTYALDLARGLWELAGRPPGDPVRGAVLHATNAGQATWFDLTRELFTVLRLDPERVRPCTTAQFPRPAPRPAFSVLSGQEWAQSGLTPLRNWREALQAAVASA